MNGRSNRRDQIVLARAPRSSGDWVSLFRSARHHLAQQEVGKWLIRLGFGRRVNAMGVVTKTRASLFRCLRVLSRMSPPQRTHKRLTLSREWEQTLKGARLQFSRERRCRRR